MELCNGRYGNDHEEIVFDSSRCPLCEVLIDLDRVMKELEILQNESEVKIT